MPAPALDGGQRLALAVRRAGCVVDHDRADGDAGVERAVEAGVADGAGVRAAAHRLELVDELHRAHLGRARDGACREAGRQHVRGAPLADGARHARHDVHDVAVALDLGEAVHADRAGVRNAAEIVAPQVDQHQVLGALLGVGQELACQGVVLGHRGAARARAGDGQHDGAPRGCLGVDTGRRARVDAREHLGAGADEREALPGRVQAVDVEVEEVGARVDLPQRAVQVEPVAGERHREALREHRLEHVALHDPLLDGAHAGLERLALDARIGLVGQERDRFAGNGGAVQEVFFELDQATCGFGERRLQVGVVGHEDRRHQHELVPDVVERRERVVKRPHAVGQGRAGPAARPARLRAGARRRSRRSPRRPT